MGLTNGFLKKEGGWNPLTNYGLIYTSISPQAPLYFSRNIFGVYKHFWRMLPAASFLSELLPPNI